jgi:predicted nucleotidyltransferase
MLNQTSIPYPLNGLTPVEQELITHFIQAVTSNSHVIQIYLYGSREKGQSDELSDLDVAVIVDKPESIRKTEKIVEQWINNQDYLILFHPVVLDKNSLMKSPVGYSVSQGRLLWTKQ